MYVSESRAPLFTTQNDNIAVEFLENGVRLYGLSPENKANILRDQYVALNLQPTLQIITGVTPKLFSIQAFDSFTWIVPNTTLEANLTMRDAVSQQFLLSLRLDFLPTSELVNFSYRLYSTPYLLLINITHSHRLGLVRTAADPSTQTPPNTSVDMAFIVKFFTQHSVVGELMPNCTTMTSGGKRCSSSLALIQSSSVFTTSGIVYSIDEATPNVTNIFSLLAKYIVDVPDRLGRSVLYIKQYLTSKIAYPVYIKVKNGSRSGMYSIAGTLKIILLPSQCHPSGCLTSTGIRQRDNR